MRFTTDETAYARIWREGGEPLHKARAEWFEHGTGPRAIEEVRRRRDFELEQMIAPGGSLADLASIAFTDVADELVLV